MKLFLREIIYSGTLCFVFSSGPKQKHFNDSHKASGKGVSACNIVDDFSQIQILVSRKPLNLDRDTGKIGWTPTQTPIT